MKECSKCRCCYEDTLDTCPLDGNFLTFTIAGTTIISGRYILEKRLGQGGMGIVFKARHKFLKSSHAIKIILPSLVSGDDSLLVRFRQEAVLAASIDHPNVIRVTDFGVENDNLPYLVMEFVDGTPLSYYLTEGSPLPFERAYELFLPIALGVAQAHKKGIVHRDLKPPNIMVQKNLALRSAVKVLDFGLAKIKSADSYPSLIQAKTQNVMGSPPYMSPEQWSGEDIDHRTDIYALGVIFYQMLAGRLPFQADSMPGMMYQHLTVPVPPLSSVGVNISPALEKVLQKALEKETQNRYSSMDEMLRDIGDSARGLVSSEVFGADTAYLIPPVPSDSRIPKPGTSPNQFSDSQRQRLATYFDKDVQNADPRLTQQFLNAQDRFEVAKTQAVKADQLLEQLAEAEKRAEEAQQKAIQAKQQIEADVRRQVEAEMEKLVVEERSKREDEARRLSEEAAKRKVAEDRANYLAQAALDAQRQAEAERKQRQQEAQQRELHEGVRRQAEVAAHQLAEQVAEAKRQYEEARKEAAREANFRMEAEARRQQIETELQAAFKNESERRKFVEAEAQKKIHDQAERFEKEAVAARRHLNEARSLIEIEARRREEAEAARLAAEQEVNRLAEEIASFQKRMDQMQVSLAADAQNASANPNLAITTESPSGGVSELTDTLSAHVARTQAGHPVTSRDIPRGLLDPSASRRKRRMALTALAGIASTVILAVVGTGAYLLSVPSPSPPVINRTDEAALPGRDMALIEGGSFLMGRNDVPSRTDLDWGNQYPSHPVTVPAFRMDRTETSNAQYAEFMAETGHPAPPSWPGGRFAEGTDNHPVTDVTLTDADAYAGWISKRLKTKCAVPTEPQWEYAARNGAKGTSFPWGAEWQADAAVLNGRPVAVGTSQDRTLDGGIFDMLGNVSEWTSTQYSLYKDHPGDKSLDKTYFSIRGLNWETPANLREKPNLLLTYRNYLTADQRNRYLGFRLACEP